MPGRFFVSSFALFTLLCAATANCSAQPSVEVLYVQQNTALLTYNVDSATLQATEGGEPLILMGDAATVRVIPLSERQVCICADRRGLHKDVALRVCDQ
jgi:hypothetical protein